MASQEDGNGMQAEQEERDSSSDGMTYVFSFQLYFALINFIATHI